MNYANIRLPHVEMERLFRLSRTFLIRTLVPRSISAIIFFLPFSVQKCKLSIPSHDTRRKNPASVSSSHHLMDKLISLEKSL